MANLLIWWRQRTPSTRKSVRLDSPRRRPSPYPTGTVQIFTLPGLR